MKLKYTILLFLFFQLFQLNAQWYKEITNINADSLRRQLSQLEGKERIDALNKIAIDLSVTDPDSKEVNL